MKASDLRPPIYRRLGDGGAVFSYSDWQTRILSPAAAIIYEALDDFGEGRIVHYDRALIFLRDELDVDVTTPAVRQTLQTLRDIGMLSE